MKIVGIYSFNLGKEIISDRFGAELQEISNVIAAVDSAKHKIKSGKRKSGRAKFLYKPKSLQHAFKPEFNMRGWHSHKIPCEYSHEVYIGSFKSPSSGQNIFRELEFVKNRVGVKVHLSNYGSVVYDVAAEMTIFHNLDIIDVGVEIVPVKEFADDMSTGVSYFEQFVWDLEQRGVSNIDIPVLILGIAA